MNIPNPEATGRRLRALRLAERARTSSSRDRWSIAGVAERIGVHPATVCRLENGKFTRSDHIRALCDLYGVPISYVLYGEVSDVDEGELHDIVANILMLPPSDVAKIGVIVERMIAERRQG